MQKLTLGGKKSVSSHVPIRIGRFEGQLAALSRLSRDRTCRFLENVEGKRFFSHGAPLETFCQKIARKFLKLNLTIFELKMPKNYGKAHNAYEALAPPLHAPAPIGQSLKVCWLLSLTHTRLLSLSHT